MADIIIFIHGVGSDKNAWDNFLGFLKKDKETKGFKEYNSNTIIDKISTYYFLYEYDSQLTKQPKFFSYISEKFTGKLCNGDIPLEYHSDTLETSLNTYKNKFDNITLVTHSMGGLVAINMLFNLLNNNNDLKKIINKCIFYGAPFNGSNEPKKLNELIGFKISSKILNELIPNSKTIKTLKKNLQDISSQLKENFEIYCILGNKDSRIIKLNKNKVNKFAQYAIINGGHSEIINPNKSENTFTVFKDSLIKQNNKKLTVVIPAGGKAYSDAPANCLNIIKDKTIIQHIINPLLKANIFDKVLITVKEEAIKAVQENIRQGGYENFVECIISNAKTIPQVLLDLQYRLVDKPFLLHYDNILIDTNKCCWQDIYKGYMEDQNQYNQIGMFLCSRFYPFPLNIGIISESESEKDTLENLNEYPIRIPSNDYANIAVMIFEPKIFNYIDNKYKRLFEDISKIIPFKDGKETIRICKVENWYHIRDNNDLKHIRKSNINLDFLEVDYEKK